jgi:hypothetical protein
MKEFKKRKRVRVRKVALRSLLLFSLFGGLQSVRRDGKNTASKLGAHTQTDRGTCPGVGL